MSLRLALWGDKNHKVVRFSNTHYTPVRELISKEVWYICSIFQLSRNLFTYACQIKSMKTIMRIVIFERRKYYFDRVSMLNFLCSYIRVQSHRYFKAFHFLISTSLIKLSCHSKLLPQLALKYSQDIQII